MSKGRSHWTNVGLTFVLTLLSTSILLPLVRIHPESVHEYFWELKDWIRIGFTFSLCVIFCGAMFRLLSPRIGHLARWKSYPPAWLAAFLAWVVAAVVDVLVGFDTHGYRATSWEWLGYGGGSLLIAGWYFGFWPEIAERFCATKSQPSAANDCITLQDIKNAPWDEIESWLESDAPARYDFLGNQAVAHRVSFLVNEGTRSMGIVGPFGAGKTSIARWVTDRLKRYEVGGRKFLVCHHSCWGFETSASAIQDMLGSAVSKLSAEVDTFQIDSLPESYRQTFSAGDGWVEAILNLVLSNPDPMEQFSRLSELLSDFCGKLVFIVEDLDRNDTRNFEIQEVLAFLERLKGYSNISFILTGGRSSSQHIDYAKLCDHIEFLRTIQPYSSSHLIERVCQQCLDGNAFPHVRLGNPTRNYEWNPLSGLLMRDFEELSLPQAVASLLSTPRSLRHALGRTFSAWHILYGEIDFFHLLTVNILRFGAPECFQFLIRRWDRLHSLPNQRSSHGEDRINGIRQAIIDDWNRTIQKVEWNPSAALQVMEFILPATEYWLGDKSQYGHSQSGQQHVTEERYWIRAINEAIDLEDVRDQEVIRDIQAWLDAPGTTTELVIKLTSSSKYSDVWENLARGLLANQRDKILLLCEQVIRHILVEQGPSACDDSQGFVHTWRFANQYVSNHQDNKAWLQDRISDAAECSIEMINALWHYYGAPGRFSILRTEDSESVRQHLLSIVKECVKDDSALVARLSHNDSATLYKLVFDPGNEGDTILAGVQPWSWLGRHILAAMRKGNVLAAANCGVLLSARVSGRNRATVDIEVLDNFFGVDSSDAIDILESMIDKLPEGDQPIVTNVVGAARQYLAVGEGLEESNKETAVD